MVSKLTIVIAKPAPLCSSSLSPCANEEGKQKVILRVNFRILCRRRTEFKAFFHFKDPGWVGSSGFSQLLHVGPRTSLNLWFVKDTCHWGLHRKGHKWMIGRTSFVVLVTQSCLTLYDPVDCSPPGSSVHGIIQARILEWVAISFSKGKRERER